MGSGRSEQVGWRRGRAVVVAVATTGAFLGLTATASAATYFVEDGGTGADPCAQADPCGSIQEAIEAHRNNSPAPDDVIDVGPGTYDQNVSATDPQDQGLTIRGTLAGGVPGTEIRGDGTANSDCADCIVALGASTPDTGVTLRDVEVTQNPTDPDADLTPILLLGGSDLDRVASIVSQDGTFAAVELCDDPGSDIADSYIDSTGTSAAGIDGCAEVDITATAIFTDDGPALNIPGTPGETSVITRSWLSAASSSSNAAASVDGGLTVDSSAISGGATALDNVGAEESDVLVSNSVLDAGVPISDDGTGWFVGRAGTDPIEATLDSSVVVDQLEIDFPGAPLTITCEYSNFTDTSTPVDTSGLTDNCPDGTEPGSTNTIESPAAIFEPFGTFDWDLEPDSPAIDAGRPGPVPAGLSTVDFFDEPRLAPGTTATCPDGVRDQGAVEALAVNCPTPPPPAQRILTVSTTGNGSGTVTGPGINCGAGGSDCAETVANGTTIELTATAADGSSFSGFSGGGCSASPCTVTMNADRSVQASFAETRATTRTLVVETSGIGTGTVTGPGIDCGGGADHTDCSQSYPTGTRVELAAEPGEDSVFGRFTGAGCDASPCTVTLDSSQAVVARFDDARIPFTTFARKPRRAERNPVFRMRTTQPYDVFECKVDKGAWEECAKRVVLRGLDPGRHRFKARAINKLGVTGPPAKARFRVKG